MLYFWLVKNTCCLSLIYIYSMNYSIKRTGMKFEFFTELKGRVYASVRHYSKNVFHQRLKVKVHAEVRLLFNKSLYTATANSV